MTTNSLSVHINGLEDLSAHMNKLEEYYQTFYQDEEFIDYIHSITGKTLKIELPDCAGKLFLNYYDKDIESLNKTYVWVFRALELFEQRNNRLPETKEELLKFAFENRYRLGKKYDHSASGKRIFKSIEEKTKLTKNVQMTLKMYEFIKFINSIKNKKENFKNINIRQSEMVGIISKLQANNDKSTLWCLISLNPKMVISLPYETLKELGFSNKDIYLMSVKDSYGIEYSFEYESSWIALANLLRNESSDSAIKRRKIILPFEVLGYKEFNRHFEVIRRNKSVFFFSRKDILNNSDSLFNNLRSLDKDKSVFVIELTLKALRSYEVERFWVLWYLKKFMQITEYKISNKEHYKIFRRYLTSFPIHRERGFEEFKQIANKLQMESHFKKFVIEFDFSTLSKMSTSSLTHLKYILRYVLSMMSSKEIKLIIEKMPTDLLSEILIGDLNEETKKKILKEISIKVQETSAGSKKKKIKLIL